MKLLSSYWRCFKAENSATFSSNARVLNYFTSNSSFKNRHLMIYWHFIDLILLSDSNRFDIQDTIIKYWDAHFRNITIMWIGQLLLARWGTQPLVSLTQKIATEKEYHIKPMLEKVKQKIIFFLLKHSLQYSSAVKNLTVN